MTWSPATGWWETTSSRGRRRRCVRACAWEGRVPRAQALQPVCLAVWLTPAALACPLPTPCPPQEALCEAGGYATNSGEFGLGEAVPASASAAGGGAVEGAEAGEGAGVEDLE